MVLITIGPTEWLHIIILIAINMKARLFFIFLIFLAFFSGCGGDKVEKEYLKSFVGNYDIYSSFSLNQKDLQCAELIINKKESVFQTYGTKEERAKYEELSNKNNDNNYNTTVKKVGVLYLFSVAAPDIKSIRVFTSKDYNSSHPAGSYLDDIVRFMSWSLNPFIKSGYKKVYTYSSDVVSATFDKYAQNYNPLISSYPQFQENYKTIRPCVPIDCLVKDLSSEDLKMLINFAGVNYDMSPRIGYIFFFFFPDAPGDFDISVEITDEKGKVYSSSFTMRFNY